MSFSAEGGYGLGMLSTHHYFSEVKHKNCVVYSTCLCGCSNLAKSERSAAKPSSLL